MEPTQAKGDYWNQRYQDIGSDKVSWFQAEPTLSLQLIRDFGQAQPEDAIADLGGGASRLADGLLAAGHTRVTVVDLSSAALAETAARNSEYGDRLSLVQADVLTWRPAGHFQVWHDRAAYHFLTEPQDQAAYWDLVRASVPVGGTIVLATFAEDGPTRCSGLPVARASVAQIAEAMGPGFQVVHSQREVHTTPGGASQPFNWVVARRV